MHEHEPRRLKEAEGTPDALNRALSALRKGPDDAARLARVSKQLEAYLDATPPAPSLRPLKPTLPVLKLVAGGALLVAPLLWLAYARFAAQEAPPSAAVTAPAAQSAPPTAAAPEPVAQPAPDEVARPQAQPTRGKPSRRAAHAERRTGKPARASEPSQGTQHAFERGESSASSGEPTASPVQPAAREPAPTKQPEPQPQPKREPVPAEQRKLASRTPSESELLFDARKALPGDAQLALRLLTEHAAHYPKGQLVPEREVLAIEALRKLGRMQEADTRLKRFQEKYPNSLHLQRLQR